MKKFIIPVLLMVLGFVLVLRAQYPGSANGPYPIHGAFGTNYVGAAFTPISGYIFLVASNNALYAVSATKTNLVSAP